MNRHLLPNPAAPADLTAAILARTSGPACGRLRDLASDLLDGTLSPDDQELADRHLTHCQACRDLISALGTALQELPGLAVVDPGKAFLANVMSRTRPPFPGIRLPEDPFLSGWTRLMRRPRAALEAAYLATAAGLILAQLPLPGATQPVGSTLVTLVRTHPQTSTAWTHLPGKGLRRAAHASRTQLLESRDIARASLQARFLQRLAQTWQRLVKTTSSVWDWVRSKARAAPRPATEPSKAPARSAL